MWAGKPIDVVQVFIDAAYVLTLRFFIQDNEPTSISNMTKHIDSLVAKGLISEGQRAAWAEAREALNRFLDSPTLTLLKTNDELLANRSILSIVVFGGYAHANERLKNEFVHITAQINDWLDAVRPLIEEMVAKIESHRTATS